MKQKIGQKELEASVTAYIEMRTKKKETEICKKRDL